MRRPDILIVEGLNVLQPPRRPADGHAASRSATSSTSRSTSTPDRRRPQLVRRAVPAAARDGVPRPASYFHRYAALTDEEAVATAERIWARDQRAQPRENILPTRSRATLVLPKGPDHSVRHVRLRKI